MSCKTYMLPCRRTHANSESEVRLLCCVARRQGDSVCACAWMPICQATGTSAGTASRLHRPSWLLNCTEGDPLYRDVMRTTELWLGFLKNAELVVIRRVALVSTDVLAVNSKKKSNCKKRNIFRSKQEMLVTWSGLFLNNPAERENWTFCVKPLESSL